MSAAHFSVGSGCNNGCRGCLWTRRLDFVKLASIPPPEDVRGRGVRLAGREPMMRPDLGDIVRGLRDAGAAGIEIETNGRGLAYPAYVKSLRDAGVTRLAIKLFAREAASWDVHTQVPGSYDQTVRGIAVTRRLAPRIQLVAVIVPSRQPGAGLKELVDFAHDLGFERTRVELRLAKLDLAGLPKLAAELHAIRSRPPVGMTVDVATG